MMGIFESNHIKIQDDRAWFNCSWYNVYHAWDVISLRYEHSSHSKCTLHGGSKFDYRSQVHYSILHETVKITSHDKMAYRWNDDGVLWFCSSLQWLLADTGYFLTEATGNWLKSYT